MGQVDNIPNWVQNSNFRRLQKKKIAAENQSQSQVSSQLITGSSTFAVLLRW